MTNRDIVVIGGSAGATAPLKQILGALPVDLPAAVFEERVNYLEQKSLPEALTKS